MKLRVDRAFGDIISTGTSTFLNKTLKIYQMFF